MSKDRKLTIIICSIVILFVIVFKSAPVYFFYQGKAALKKQDYVKAHNNLRNSYLLNKNNKDYRYYYVKSLLTLSPTITVQKELFEIASSSTNDSAQDLAENKISEWRNNVMRNIGDNYIEQAPMDKGIMRWDSEKFPLKIAIINNSGIQTPPYYNEEIYKAFNQWEISTQFLKFAPVKNLSDANIIVKIKPLPDDICTDDLCRYVVGYTTPDFKGKFLNKMTIVLYAKDPYGNFLSDKELYNTTLHEIGHALGIMGHSYSSEDLMYMSSDNKNFYTPYRSSFQYLSSQDINTIKLLYKLIPTITNSEKINTKGLVYAPIILGTSKDISSRKLKEAQMYVKNAPEIAGGYIDMGIAYAELGKNNDAVKAIQKAYELSKTESERYMCLYNLSAIYMNSGELDKALAYANEAKKIMNTDEIKELITNIQHAKVTKTKPFRL